MRVPGRFWPRSRAARFGARCRATTSSRCFSSTRGPEGPATSTPAFRTRVRGVAGLARIPVPRRAGSTARPRRAPPTASADVELASRLSFFLWSSIPDDELLDLADRRQAERAGGARAAGAPHACRIGAPMRSSTNFAGQWLHLRNVETVTAGSGDLPVRRRTAHRRSPKETELFVASIVREDRSLLDLLTADYTFVNERLAEHYGIPNVYGSQFRRVTVTDPNRRGLLGQGSILTVTSYPNRTSVVQRGKWMLENLLGTPPPPPPPDVPELAGEAATARRCRMREQMEAHRANPVCAACHARMDPIGFALENYDGVGQVARPKMPARRSMRSGTPAGRHRVPTARAGLTAVDADQLPGRFRADGHREAADLCARPGRRVTTTRRPCGRSPARPRPTTIDCRR